MRLLLVSTNTQDCGAAGDMEMKEVQTLSCNGITLALLFHCNERRN